MANLKLINGSTEQTFSNVETIKCPTDDGGTQIFETQKERQAKTVSLSLSEGNQEITPDDGKVLSNVTIEKPESLVPENIRSGVDIGGVEGSLVEPTLTAETIALNMVDGDQILTAPDGTAYSTVTITKPSTLVPENIRIGIDIGGIEGEYGGEGASSIEWDDITGKPNVATVEYVDEAIANLPSGGGASVSTETEIFGEQAVEFQADSSLGGLYSKGYYEAEGDVVFQLIAGETYFVEWDGETYECVAAAGTLGTANGIYIGNLSIAGLEGDTGEPFLVADAVNTETAFNMLISNDTEASHTVRIYQKAPLQVSWENVTDKPFGEKSKPYTWLNNAEFVDTWTPDENNSNGGSWEGAPAFPVSQIEHPWIIGETYTLILDGVEYSGLEAFNLQGIAVAVGNTAMAGGVDNGLPFALAQLIDGSIVGVDTPIYMLMIEDGFIPSDPTVTTTRTIVITVKGNASELIQIDPKYVPDLYYEEKDKVILENNFSDMWTPDSENEEGGIWQQEAFMALSKENVLVADTKYNLTVDGTLYENLVPFAFTFNGMPTLGIGNPVFYGAGDDNGCPVAIFQDVYGALLGLPLWLLTHDSPTPDDPTVVSYIYFDIKLIQAVPVVHQMDPKYIPDMYRTVLGDEVVTENVISCQSTTSAHGSILVCEIIENETYVITYNGTEYIRTAQKYADKENSYYVGNLAIVNSGNPDTGEPFAAITNYYTSTSDNLIFWFFDSTGDKKVSIKKQDTIITVPEKYLPTPPEFDLTAMGLPAVAIGSYSQLDDVDVTNICAALEKGLVKFTFAFNYEGTEIPAVYLGLGISALGGWQSNCILNFQGAPVFGSLIFDQTNRQITARITPLGVAA